MLQYLQLDCTLFIGSDGGKRIHSDHSLGLSAFPGREQLVLNAGPDGWYWCQTSLQSEAAALASVTLYLDKLAVFSEIQLHCKFLMYVDSSSAITNVECLNDLKQNRRYVNNADILLTMAVAHPVLKRFSLEHVKSHQDDSTEFEKNSFSAHLNVLCNTMATNKRQPMHVHEQTLEVPLSTPRNLPLEISYRRHELSFHYVAILREEIGLDRHRHFLQRK